MTAGGAPSSLDAALAEAKAAHQSGDLRTANRLYRKILARAPNCAEAHNLFGILESQRGDPAKAAWRIGKAIDIDRNVTDYRVNLAVVLEAAGNLRGAFDSYIAALAIEPRNTDILTRLMPIVEHGRFYHPFAEILTQLCATIPDYAEAHYLLGNALNMMRRFGEAAASFRRAIRLAPHFADGHANLASALMDMGRPADALAACDDCLKIDPGHCFAMATKTIASAETGNQQALRPLIDFNALLDVRNIKPPPGYADIESFNAALEDAVLNDPTLRNDPDHRSCHFADQTNDLFLNAHGPMAAFEATIRSAMEEYCKRLDEAAKQPFLANPMPPTTLVGWATVMESQGHQSAHIHPTSWLSGVYYVTVPYLVHQRRNTPQGWIEFGRPPDHYPTAVEPKTEVIEPEEGKLILFPSYLYHRTIPYDDNARRISIAFDFDTGLVA